MTTDMLATILDEVSSAVARTDRAPLAALAAGLDEAGPVFVAGEGRSGFMAKAFAMRLTHLGLRVHVVGETTTPAIGPDATLVAVSGSGTTAGTVRVADTAVEQGARLWAVTTDPDSPLAQSALAADGGVVVIPAATKHRRPGEASTIQPLSSLFDQTVHLALDAVCLMVSSRRQIDNDAARATHSNME